MDCLASRVFGKMPINFYANAQKFNISRSFYDGWPRGQVFYNNSRYLMQAYGHPKFTNHTLSKLIVREVYTTLVLMQQLKVLVSYCQWKNRRTIDFQTLGIPTLHL